MTVGRLERIELRDIWISEATSRRKAAGFALAVASSEEAMTKPPV
jgi:hypothetical protein